MTTALVLLSAIMAIVVGWLVRHTLNVSPWQAVFAGAAITLAVLSFNLMGDALRDILDPRLRI